MVNESTAFKLRWRHNVLQLDTFTTLQMKYRIRTSKEDMFSIYKAYLETFYSVYNKFELNVMEW